MPCLECIQTDFLFKATQADLTFILNTFSIYAAEASTILHTFTFHLLATRQQQRERDRDSKKSCTYWVKYSNNQSWVRLKPEPHLGLPHGWQKLKYLSRDPVFPGTLAGTWTQSGAACIHSAASLPHKHLPTQLVFAESLAILCNYNILKNPIVRSFLMIPCICTPASSEKNSEQTNSQNKN